MRVKASPTGKRLARPILASHLPRLVKVPVKPPVNLRWLISLSWVVTLSLMT